LRLNIFSRAEKAGKKPDAEQDWVGVRSIAAVEHEAHPPKAEDDRSSGRSP
jgi:hypothetical protein